MLKGILTIVKRDAETNKIKSVHTETNDITSQGWENLGKITLGGSSIDGRIDGRSTGSAGYTTQPLLTLGTRRLTEVPACLYTFGGYAIGTVSPVGPLVKVVEKTSTTPWYIELINRFNPGATLRTIWGIGISTSTTVNAASATYAALSAPCIQDVTDILDVYYRIQYLEPTADDSTFPQIALIDQAWAQWGAGVTASQTFNGTNFSYRAPYYVEWAHHKPVPGNYYNFYESLSYRDLYAVTVNNVQNGVPDLSSISFNNSFYGQIRATINMPITGETFCGTVISSQLYSSYHVGYPYLYTEFSTNHIPDGWEPVQPIHKHSNNATAPFLGVDALASGTGTVNATGNGTWWRRDYPEFYRININATGDVGTSKYSVMKRVLTGGYYNNSYMNYLAAAPVLPTDWHGDLTTKYAQGSHITQTSQIPGATTRRLFVAMSKMEAVDATHIASFDNSGVQIFNVRDNIYRNFDADGNHAPAVNFTGINQVAVDGDGYLWVADSSIGLYKLTVQEFDIRGVTTGVGGKWIVAGDASAIISPADTVRVVINKGTRAADTTYTVNTVTVVGDTTEITVTGSIHADATGTGILQIDRVTAMTGIGGSVVDTNCYAVSAGYNNTVWALFNGGLARTNDGGATWIVYDTTSTPAFNYTGITDGNWSSVRFMRVQPDSQSFRMGFMTSTAVTNATGTVVWWSIDGTSITGPVVDLISAMSPVGSYNLFWQLDTTCPNTFTVSKTGGWWQTVAVVYAGSNYRGLASLKWGTTLVLPFTNHNITTGTYSHADLPGYVYDDYGAPYSFGCAISNSTSYYLGMMDRAGALYSHGNVGTWSANYGGPSSVNNVGELISVPLNLTKGVSVLTTSSNVAALSMSGTFGLLYGAPTIFRGFRNTAGDSANANPLNAAGTSFEGNRITTEWVWDKYHYDATAGQWKKNWFASAVDSSGNGYDGERKGFNTEDHTFTGRSTIKVPSAALSTHFTNQLTFSARVTPTAKLTDQLPGHIILSYIDETLPSNNMYLMVSGSDKVGAGNIFLMFNSETVMTGTSTTYVNGTTEVVTFYNDHGWTTGDAVYYDRPSALAYPYNITGLTDGTIYYVRVITSNSVSFYPTAADAIADTNKILLTGSATTYPATVKFTKVYPFGTGLALDATANVQLIINGTSASVYVNNVQSGTTQTLSTPLNLSSANGRMVIGGIWYHPESDTFDFTENMFRGEVANVLIDSVAWTGTEVAAYHANPLTYTTGTTRVRYQFNEAFDGLAMDSETKPTHVASEEIVNGVKVRFTSGVATPSSSFVATDYYTFGVVDGVLKDNATSYTHDHTVAYYRPIDNNVNVFTPATVPASSTVETGRPTWRGYSPSYTTGPFHGSPTPYFNYHTSFQQASGDFDLSFKTSNMAFTTSAALYIGLDVDTSGDFNWRWRLNFEGNGTVDVFENNASVAADITTWDYNDQWNITRVGNTVTYYKNGVPFRVSPVTSTEAVYVRAHMSDYPAAVLTNVEFTYDRPAYTVMIGDSGTQTGWYSPKFWNIDGIAPNTLDVKLDGTPVTVSIPTLTSTIDGIGVPGAGTCYLIPDAGMLVFNPADAGKTVTGRFTLLKTKP